MNRLVHITIAVIFFTISAWAQDQDGRYIVFFKDKLETPYTIDNPSLFLSQKSIDRRQRQGIVVVEEDLPVNPDYVTELTSLNITLHYTLKWINGALIEASSENLESIKNLSSVLRILYVAPPSQSHADEPNIEEVPPTPSTGRLLNADQLATIGLDDLHADGQFGEGVTIAVLDDGFRGVNIITPFESLFQENRIEYTYDFVGGSPDVFRYDDHGTMVLSIMAANMPDVYMGGSPKAIYQLYVTEDIRSEYRVEEYNWMAATERADSVGADIIISSLGYNTFDDVAMDYTRDQMDGITSVVSQATTKALSKGMVVITSAGNYGDKDWRLITTPADAKGVLAVGSVANTYERSSFSSVGPTADGRIKPDVVALGSQVLVIQSNASIRYGSGTSYAAPFVASFVAGLMQIYPNATSRQLYDMVIDLGTNSKSPNNQIGYGLPRYSVITFAVVEDPSSEEDKYNPLSSAFKLFPNPASSHYIKVHLNNTYAQHQAHPITLHVYDLQSRLAMISETWVKPTDNIIRYDISMLAPGFYIVKIDDGTVQQAFRWVKY